MKIIKEVNPKFIHKCKYCKSVYEYSAKDVIHTLYNYIKCPVCENIDNTSIFDKKSKGGITMLSEEEMHDLEILAHLEEKDFNNNTCAKSYIDLVMNAGKKSFNLITKLQKENEYWKNGFERELEANRENTCELLKQDLMIKEKDKQIQLMSEYMEENMDEHQLDEIYAKQYNCNGMERNWTRGKEKEVEDIKQFFEKLAKEKDI